MPKVFCDPLPERKYLCYVHVIGWFWKTAFRNTSSLRAFVFTTIVSSHVWIWKYWNTQPQLSCAMGWKEESHHHCCLSPQLLQGLYIRRQVRLIFVYETPATYVKDLISNNVVAALQMCPWNTRNIFTNL